MSGWWRWDGRREEPAGQDEPKQPEAPKRWPELLEEERKRIRQQYDSLQQGPDDATREQAYAEEGLTDGLFDLILTAAGRDKSVIGEPSPDRVAQNVAVRVQWLAARLLNTLDKRYEPKARRPDHDYTMPHTYIPGHAPQCPPNCPGLLPAPTLWRLWDALVVAGIPVVDEARVEAPEAAEAPREQSTLEVVAALLGVDPDDAELDNRVLEALGRLQGELAAALDVPLPPLPPRAEWQRLAVAVGVDLTQPGAFTRIADAVEQMAWHDAEWITAGARIQAALRAPTANPSRLADRVETLAASERQQIEASSHREQLREHYRLALTELVATLDDRPLLAEQIVNTAEKARKALDNPPAWDGQVRP